MHVKKGDSVVVLSGADKGKKGKIAHAFPARGVVVVEGINMKKKHQRARQQGKKGQVIEIAMPIAASKVRLTEKGAAPAKKKASK
ncbi:MAG TPA: 50S ribosomal protein L24 [Candidatus Paceibacterota bacterium]|nr:50S ribosomal protein L24 [Candidatus Paceibacterota bacterium]